MTRQYLVETIRFKGEANNLNKYIFFQEKVYILYIVIHITSGQRRMNLPIILFSSHKITVMKAEELIG